MTTKNDEPIDGAEEDLLGRAALAQSFVSNLRALDFSEGLVVGVMGEWGAGKSSFINLMRGPLAEAPPFRVVDFNPWLFSGTADLVQFFFRELAHALKNSGDARLVEVSKGIEDYAEALAPLLGVIPVVGGWIERASKLAGGFRAYAQWRKGDTRSARDRLVSELKKPDTPPVVVIIDDIDRLTTQEIREIFKLVRLTASFPKVVYLLAFDRVRVEQALTGDGLDGRSYLEKIIQLGFDLPALPQTKLNAVLFDSLNQMLEDVDPNIPIDDALWMDIFPEVVSPLVRHLRDVRRYVLAMRATLTSVGSRIELADLLGLEALRVFRPDRFVDLMSIRRDLGKIDSGYGSRTDDAAKQRVLAVIERSGKDSDVVKDLLHRLFPATDRHTGNMHWGAHNLAEWLRNRRVAHPDVLSLYVEQVASARLVAFDTASNLLTLANDEAALELAFAEVKDDDLPEVASSLEAFEGVYPEDAIVPVATALYNVTGRMPERDEGMFSMPPEIMTTRVVLRMIRNLGEDKILTMSYDILRGLKSLSSKLSLVLMLGHREHVGHGLVSDSEAKKLEAALRREIRSTPPEQLATEWNLLRVLHFVRGEYKSDRPAPVDLSNAALLRAILLDSSSSVRSNAMGNRAVRSSARLAWETFVTVLGGEARAREAVETLKSLNDAELAPLLVLADKYLGGWKPDHRFTDDEDE